MHSRKNLVPHGKEFFFVAIPFAGLGHLIGGFTDLLQPCVGCRVPRAKHYPGQIVPLRLGNDYCDFCLLGSNPHVLLKRFGTERLVTFKISVRITGLAGLSPANLLQGSSGLYRSLPLTLDSPIVVFFALPERHFVDAHRRHYRNALLVVAPSDLYEASVFQHVANNILWCLAFDAQIFKVDSNRLAFRQFRRVDVEYGGIELDLVAIPEHQLAVLEREHRVVGELRKVGCQFLDELDWGLV